MLPCVNASRLRPLEGAVRPPGEPTQEGTPAQVERRAGYPVLQFVGHVVIPVLCGATLYIGWRSSALLFHQWLAVLGLQDLAIQLHRNLVKHPLPSFVVYSVPDALWCYALVSHLGRLWA